MKKIIDGIKWSHLALTGILILAACLRLWQITSLPPSLYWEEAALGYDAFSVSQTGRDHHGNWFPIVAFESFGDWKPSLYFYAIVPFIYLFDLSALAVRLPAAIAGISVLISLYFIVKKVTKNQRLAVVSVLIGAINPWLLQFSRAGWEAMLATALVTAGMACGLYAVEMKKVRAWLIMLSSLFLVLSLYTYHGTRLLAPLLGLTLLFWWWQQLGIKTINAHIQKYRLQYGVWFVGMLLILFPLARSFTSPQVQQRFAQTSIFSDATAVEMSNDLRSKHDYSLLSRLLYHRYWFRLQALFKGYFSHLTINFLAVSGDANPRHNTQFTGQLLYPSFGLLILGFLGIRSLDERYRLVLLAWFLLAFLPAALTKTTPHALRSLPAVPVVLVFVIHGLEVTWGVLPKKFYLRRLSLILIAMSYVVFFSQFFRYYTQIYSQEYSGEWQYGYQQMLAVVKEHKEDGEVLYITREQGRPSMYYFFFSKIDPKLVQAASPQVSKDQSELLIYDDYHFVDRADQITGETGIIAGSPAFIEEISQRLSIKVLGEVRLLNNEVVWQVVSYSSK